MAQKQKTDEKKQETTGTEGVPAVTLKEVSVDKILEQVDVSNQVFYVPEQYNHLFKVAQQISSSSIIPKHFQGNASNCFIALVRAEKMNIDPFWFMEQTYVVHGKLGVQAKLVIALINKSNIFKGRLVFELTGEDKNRSCICKGILRENGMEVSQEVSYQMAVKNGWTAPVPVYEWDESVKKKVKTSKTTPSKWDMLTDLMLQYRSASFLGNVYCPDVLGGMTVIEESETFNNEPEQDKGPLFDKKPEEPSEPEVKPDENKKSEKEKEDSKPPKTVDELAAFMELKKISREQFNSYLFAKKALGEGEDMVSLTIEKTKKLCLNCTLTATDCKEWLKNNASE